MGNRAVISASRTAPEAESEPESEPEPTLAGEPIPEPEPVAVPQADATPAFPEPVDEAAPPLEPPEEPTPPPAPEPEPVPGPEPIPMPPAPEPEAQPEPAAEPESEPQPAAAERDEREALIDSLHARLEAQEQELVRLRELLAQERARGEVQVHVWPEEQAAVAPTPPAQREHYLLCVPTSAGYVLLDRVGVLPSVAQVVDVPEEEGHFTVTKIVRLPRNGRPCAYLQRA